MLKLEVIFKERPINLSSGTSLFISTALDILEQFNMYSLFWIVVINKDHIVLGVMATLLNFLCI